MATDWQVPVSEVGNTCRTPGRAGDTPIIANRVNFCMTCAFPRFWVSPTCFFFFFLARSSKMNRRNWSWKRESWRHRTIRKCFNQKRNLLDRQIKVFEGHPLAILGLYVQGAAYRIKDKVHHALRALTTTFMKLLCRLFFLIFVPSKVLNVADKCSSLFLYCTLHFGMAEVSQMRA